jgi:hypothetical protein
MRVEIVAVINEDGTTTPTVDIEEILEDMPWHQDVDFPDANGQLAVISGMPMSAVVLVSLNYKNVFGAIAVANPRNGVAEIAHSVNPNYKVGTVIPLQ